MGQQQLLLIVLGVIIVGIAIVVGINIFTTSSIQANRDAVIGDLTNLASMAQSYYRKPTAMGGGGNDFTGWTIPATFASDNGTYAATVDNATQITLVGTGTETGDDGANPVQVTMIIGPQAITSTTIDN